MAAIEGCSDVSVSKILTRNDLVTAVKIKALLNDFAIRSFRDTADGDYIAARMAFRAALYQQFFWSSQQTVEKYIKCILLLNRIPAQKMRHNLLYGLDKIDKEGKFKLRLSPSSREFIEHLSMYGSHRYFETSYYSLGREIVTLDRTVWELRRYCTVLDYCLEKSDGQRKEMLEIELRRIEQSENDSPQRFVLMGGFLEKVIKSKEHQARKSLLWKNLFFGTSRRKSVRIGGGFYSANAPLFLHPEILDEVLKYILIPQNIVKAYKQQS